MRRRDGCGGLVVVSPRGLAGPESGVSASWFRSRRCGRQALPVHNDTWVRRRVQSVGGTQQSLRVQIVLRGGGEVLGVGGTMVIMNDSLPEITSTDSRQASDR